MAASPGRRAADAGDDDEDAIRLTSVDALDAGVDVESSGNADATEDEYLRIEQALVLRRVARTVLEPRDLRIFLEIHFNETPRKDLADEFDITQARVSQIYRQSIRQVREASRDNPAFSITHPDEGRPSHD